MERSDTQNCGKITFLLNVGEMHEAFLFLVYISIATEHVLYDQNETLYIYQLHKLLNGEQTGATFI